MEIPSNITQSYLQDGTNFYSFYEEIKIQPEKMPTSTSETIKFIFTTSPNIYINTQTFMLEFDIGVDTTETQGCNLILDGSGQSLIEEIKLEVNAQVIEQVVKYDVVSSELEHMGVGPMSKQHRYYFGFVDDSEKSQFLDQNSNNFRQASETQYDRGANVLSTTDASYNNTFGQANTGSCHAFMPYDLIPKQLSQAPVYIRPDWLYGTGPDNLVNRNVLYDYYTHAARDAFKPSGFTNAVLVSENYGRPSGFYGWSKVDHWPSSAGGGPLDLEHWQGWESNTATIDHNTKLQYVVSAGDRINQVVFPNLNFTITGEISEEQRASHKVQRGYSYRGFMEVDTFRPVGFTRHRPEAVEFLLSGNGGIQGPHSYLLVNHCDTKVRTAGEREAGYTVDNKQGLWKIGRVDVNSFDPAVAEGELEGYNFHGTEAVSMYGYQVISSNLTSKFAKNLHLGADYYQYWLKNGSVLDTPVKTSRMKILVPINSAIMGELNQKYIPGSCMGRMVLHVTLNKYAFFLSGLSNVYDGWDITNAANLQKAMVPRNWTFSNVQLVMEGYRFGQAQNDALQERLTGGLLNNNLQAYQAGEYIVTGTSALNSNWNLTCRIPAVRLITMAIYSNDYMNYTFCRKLFRLSGNITRLRLRITDTYLPQEPITGNAGNPVCFDSNSDSNINFLIWTHKSLACFKDNQAYCVFNNMNFAINDRAFNPDIYTYPKTQLLPLENLACLGCKHLWYGQTGILEENYYGMALYIWAFGEQPMMPQANVGLDTRNLDIFYVEVATETSDVGNNRPETIIFTAFADFIFRVYQRNIVVMGK